LIYDALTMPLVAVIPKSGSAPVEVSLKEVFENAHEYYDIAGDTPMERYAQIRFLAAFAMDMLNIKTAKARGEAIAAGRFNKKQLEDYIKTCVSEGASFDLFDPCSPFMQTVFEEKERNKRLKPVSCLDLTFPSGNAHVFYQATRFPDAGVLKYAVQEQETMTPPKAFRSVLVRQLYCPYSTEGPGGIHGNFAPMFLYMVGKNLYETILLNTMSEEEVAPREYGIGTVPWRKNGLRAEDREMGKATFLQAFTWIPRRIQLILSDDGLIRQIYFGRGFKWTGKGTWKDPAIAHFRMIDKKTGEITLSPMTLKRERDHWLFLNDVMTIDTVYEQPDGISCNKDFINDDIRIRMDGLEKNPQKYILFVMKEEELDLPAAIVHDEQRLADYKKDVRMMDRIASGVRYYVKDKYPQCVREINRNAKYILTEIETEDILKEASSESHTETICAAAKDAMDDVIRILWMQTGSSSADMLAASETEKNIRFVLWKAIKERKGEEDVGGEDGEAEVEREGAE